VLLTQVILRYKSLSSNYFDLGIFYTNFYNVNEDISRAFNGHVQPLMIIFGYIYNQSVAFDEILPLLLQYLSFLLAVMLIYKNYNLTACLALLLYYPSWANILLDFHFDSFAILILSVFFIEIKKERVFNACLAALLLMFLKETFALQAIFCGIFIIISSKNKILGFLLIIISSLYFYYCVEFILPYYSSNNVIKYNINQYYHWLGFSLPEIIIFIIKNPFTVIVNLFSIEKFKYILLIFGLLGFIPLLSLRPLIIAIPPVLLSLLAVGNDGYYSIGNHYTAGIIIPLIISLYNGLELLRKNKYTKIYHKFILIYFYVILIMGHILFTSSPIGRLFWSNKVYSYSWRSYFHSERINIIQNAIIKYIPKDKTVAVTTQNNINNAFLSNRIHYFPFPIGINEPYKYRIFNEFPIILTKESINTIKFTQKEIYADYVIIDTKKPIFVFDKGCDYIFNKCNNLTVLENYNSYLNYLNLYYNKIYDNDGFIIYKK
jgi:uncharacterized membrane protein